MALPSPKERVFKKALLLEGAVDFFEYGHEHKESLILRFIFFYFFNLK